MENKLKAFSIKIEKKEKLLKDLKNKIRKLEAEISIMKREQAFLQISELKKIHGSDLSNLFNQERSDDE